MAFGRRNQPPIGTINPATGAYTPTGYTPPTPHVNVYAPAQPRDLSWIGDLFGGLLAIALAIGGVLLALYAIWFAATGIRDHMNYRDIDPKLATAEAVATISRKHNVTIDPASGAVTLHEKPIVGSVKARPLVIHPMPDPEPDVITPPAPRPGVKIGPVGCVGPCGPRVATVDPCCGGADPREASCKALGGVRFVRGTPNRCLDAAGNRITADGRVVLSAR